MKNKIYIYDCDYLTNPNNIFNSSSMKLSSYHKQMHDEVHLIEDKNFKPFDYDIIYVIRENWNSELPSVWILDNNKTISYGKAMELFTNYKELPAKVAAVRPDYLLFLNKDLDKISRYHRIQYIQFYSGLTELKLTQDYTNTFSGQKINMVVDDCLWDLPIEKLKEKLNYLKKIKNIAFLYPIKIKVIMDNPEIRNLFLSLEYDKIYRNKIKNNYGGDINKIKEIIDLLSNFKNYKYFKPLKVQTITKPHNSNEIAREDLWRSFEIMTYALSKKVRINMTVSKIHASYYWEYFAHFKEWSNVYSKNCYIEYMTRYACKMTNKTPTEVINDSLQWYSLNVRELIYLISKYPKEMNKYIYQGWGKKEDIFVDIDYIRKAVL